MNAFICRSLAVLGASLLAAMPAQALEYTFRSEAAARWYAINNAGQIAGDHLGAAAIWGGRLPTILPLFEGGLSSSAAGINNLGQVVGAQYVQVGSSHEYMATLWTPGQAPVALGHLGNGTLSVARDINDAGQITGRATTEGGHTGNRAFRWHAGTMTDLGAAGGLDSYGEAINATGQVAGSVNWHQGDLDEHRAVVWTGTEPTRLEGPGGGDSVASDINSRGQVVGGSNLWNGATATYLDRLDPAAPGSSSAWAINELGQVVGSSFTEGEETSRAVLWDNGTPIDLNSLLSEREREAGWFLVEARDINDLGQIVGTGYNRRGGVGLDHAFLLTPVPEPANVAMLLAGLGLVGCAVRKRASGAST